MLGRLDSEEEYILAIVQGVFEYAPSLLPVPICSVFSYFIFLWSRVFHILFYLEGCLCFLGFLILCCLLGLHILFSVARDSLSQYCSATWVSICIKKHIVPFRLPCLLLLVNFIIRVVALLFTVTRLRF